MPQTHATTPAKRHATQQVKRHAYSIDEAAEAITLSRWMIHKLIREGKLRSSLVGGRRLIPADALDDLLADTSA
jgi:excisionase family DNA binding protein